MSHQAPAGGQSASFNTNVNRAKTKKWVEAKSYSYDGDDWGEVDDYDEYGGYDERGPEPAPTAKPTGLRQRGQSASQMPQDPYSARQDPYQSPVDTRIHSTTSGLANRQQQQQHGSRSVTNPHPEPQAPTMRRINSFDPEDERRAFSAGAPLQSMSKTGLGIQSPIQHNQGQNPVRHDFQPGQTYPNQTPQDQPSPARPSVHTPNRPSMDESVRSVGPPQQLTGTYQSIYPDQPLQLSAGGRTQSMASTNSALDFHNRRDFSPSAMPPPLQTRGSPSPNLRSSPSHPPRKSSLSQEKAPSLPFDAQAPATTGVGDAGTSLSPARERAASGAGKALPFVRPADIYRRMQEERERERQSQESVRPSMDTIMGETHERPGVGNQQDNDVGQRLKPTLDPVSERRSEYGFEGVDVGDQLKPEERRPTTSKKFELPNRNKITSPQGASPSLQPMLPDVSRVSGFGESFFGSTNGSHEPSQAPFENFTEPTASVPVQQEPHEATPDKDLRTQPSLGFTSAVHEAFDRAENQVPPTPSSAAGSTVERSTSGGTSTVSPIISRGPSTATENWHPGLPGIDDVTTPTTVDAHGSSRPMSSSSLGTPKQIARKPSPSPAIATIPQLPDLPSPSFVPGHRRDLSTPSPDNSPAKTPALEVNRQLRQPQEVELAAATPTKPSFSTDNSSNVSEVAEQGSNFTDPTETEINGGADVHVESQPLVKDFPGRVEQAGSPIPYPQSYLRTRTDSGSSSRVRDLADRFESGSRPGSAHSATPRSSAFGNPMQKDDLIPSRPLADRMESFRPHLPGGWESSASIAPAAALRRPESTVDRTRPDSIATTEAPKEEVVTSPVQAPSSVSQIKDASEDAFIAVAAAGTALAGAFAAAVGMEQRNGSEASAIEDASDEQAIPRRSEDHGSATHERKVSTNAVVNPEATKSFLANNLDDEESSTAAPTPLAMETPLHPAKSSETPDYFRSSDSQAYQGSVDQSNGMAPANRPPMLPSLNTDREAPQYESDRLRREIVRELSPMISSEPTTAQSDYSNYENTSRLSSNQSLPRPGYESGVLPREYESYWNDPNSDDDTSHFTGELDRLEDATTAHRPQGAALIGEPLSPRHLDQGISPGEPLHLSQPIEYLPSDPTIISEGSQDRPQVLQHRFSWEQPLQSPQPIPADPDTTHEALGSSTVELPKVAESNTVNEAPDGSVSDFLKSAVYPEGQSFRPQHPREASQVSGSPISVDAPEKLKSRIDQEVPFPASQNISGLHDETVDFERELPEHDPGLEVEPSSLENGHAKKTESGYDDDTNFVGQESPILQSERWQNIEVPVLEPSLPEPPIHDPAPKLSARDDELPLPAPSFQPKITAFREILALKSPSERIRAYDDTREQFANQNTGLAHWLAITANDLPEHADLWENPTRRPAFQVHKPSPSRSKFSGLLQSGGHSSQPYPNNSQSALESAGPLGNTSSYVYSPSGGSSGKLSSQQVQAKGKDLLHTAGVFGGKANVAAKGLFSKGKSKLRGSSGVEKAPPALPQTYDSAPRGMQQQPRIIEAPLPVQRASRATSPSTVQGPHDMCADIDRTTVQPRVLPQGDSPAIVSRVDAVSAAKKSSYHHDFLNGAATRAPFQDPQLLPQSSEQTSLQDTPSLESYTQSQEGDDERSEESDPTTQEHPPRASSLYLKEVTRQGQSHSPQAPAGAGDNASILPRELPLVDSYVGSSKEVQTPRSTTSSNKTPTQATFTDTGQPAIPATFPVSTDGTSTRYHRGAESSPTWSSQPQSGFSATTSSNGRRGQEPEAGPRFSQDSEGTFHTADGGDGLLETSSPKMQNTEYQPAGRNLYSQVPTDENMPHQSETYQRNYKNSPTKVQNSRPTILVRDSMNSQLQARDYSWRGPSIDSEAVPMNFDHPPSPLTPQQPTSHDVPEQRGRTGPVHYGIDHDFDRPNDTEHSRSRSPSYSRLSQDTRRSQESRPSIDPNILDHPAFRAVAEGNGMPAQDYGRRLTREEDLVSRHQTAEQMIVGSGPPIGRRSGSRSQSKRGSRSSAFFKAFTSPSKSDQPPLPNAADSQASSSPRNSPAVGDRKSKTFSIFHSRSGNKGSRSGESRGTENMASRDAPPRSSVTQVGPVTPRPVEDDISSKVLSSKRNKKLQRASTSSKPEPDGGKKKRFSAIGTLFGGRKRQSSTQQSRVSPQQSFQHSSPIQTQQREPYNSVEQQRSQQDDYGTPRADYIQPPHEGYYAPSRQNGESSQTAGAYRSPNSSSRRSGQAHSRAPDPPAYVQDSALRVRQLMSPIEQPNTAILPRNSTFPQRSPQHPSPGMFKSSRSDQMNTGEGILQTPEPQTKASGSSWTRFSTHSRSKSRQEQARTPSNGALSSPPLKHYAPAPQSNNAAAVRQSFQEPGRRESPPPPPPPPKDDWHRTRPRDTSALSSQRTNQDARHSPSPSQSSPPHVSPHQRQSLPPLQTNMRGNTSRNSAIIGSGRTLTPEEKRKSRQLEIERSTIPPPKGPPARSNAPGYEREEGVREVDDDDAEPVMSATSFPGQMWQPSYAHWED